MSLTGNAETKVLRGRINRLDTLCVNAYEIAVKNGFEGTEEEWLATFGQNGVSCTHEWDGTILTVTSASGTSSMDLQGEGGYTPQKGVDYFTEEDKQELTSMILDEIPFAEGVSV